MMKKQPQVQHLVTIFSLVLFLVAFFAAGEGTTYTRTLLNESPPVLAADTNQNETVYIPLALARRAGKSFLPLILSGVSLPELELIGAWTSNTEGQQQDTFYLGDTIQYISSGENPGEESALAELTWSQEGPCGTTVLYSDTVILPAGSWQHNHSEITPECAGDYIGSVQIDHMGTSSTLTTTFQVHLPSQVITNTQHGFDRCWLPTVNQMQAWWDESPYYVWNIYLGGIHYFCPSEDLTTAWVQSVAQQGWKFSLTWVGPQAPCSVFIHKFSGNPLVAFGEGKDEAAAALAAAESLGISGEKIIYYDMEFYPSSNPECNQAVNAFLEGWNVWLHLQGDFSGVYSSPCFSNIKEWASILPPPDDVWIAHWISEGYDPLATVWDVACGLPNSYWANHQRIRQYAGEHTANWGGVTLTIDSNVLDGQITEISGTVSPMGSETPASRAEYPEVSNAQIREMDLISPDMGWLLLGDRLLVGMDGGNQWREITPDIGNATIMSVAFLNEYSGWMVTHQSETTRENQFTFYKTEDGGATWVPYPFPVSMPEIAAVYLEFIDEQTGWALFKIRTGSSFSLGRLFATRDGGITWEERTAPMGEPVTFVDTEHGWMVGGPSGNQIYQTRDGGLTWRSLGLPGLPDGQAYIGRPVFETAQNGKIPVSVLSTPRSSFLIYATGDGGDSWQIMRDIELAPGFEPGEVLPFSLKDGRWWAATPDSKDLLTSANLRIEPDWASTTGLPPGVVELDFVTSEVGWALIQDNQCYGDKIPSDTPESIPFTCQSETRLFHTDDGGFQWDEIQP
jgi:photosystem II stability/assembly factor-like uncharacterized protein